MATLTDVKTQLATIEAQFTIPLTDLDGMINAARAQLDATVGAEIVAMELQIEDLQNQLSVLQGTYDAEMTSIDNIDATRKLVATLKDTMAAV